MATKKNINIDVEQLQKLQKDYTERVKAFNKQATKCEEREYVRAGEYKLIGETYAICASNIKTILSGHILYTKNN